LTVALAVASSAPAQAQTPEQLLRGVLDIARQSAQQASPPAPPANTVYPGMVAPVRTAPEPSVAYPTKQDLLAAAARGNLTMLGKASGEDRQQLVNSVLRILRLEYGVPPLPENCDYWFASDVHNLFALVTAANVETLSDKAPEFYNHAARSQAKAQEINERLNKLQSPRDPTACDSRAMGRVMPHPYKTSLPALLSEYAKATQEYVETERAARKQAYQQAVEQQQAQERERQAAAQQRQAEARAVEQTRIDAEAARIRQEQQRRAQQDKARVGG
jgi:hypothetical protein